MSVMSYSDELDVDEPSSPISASCSVSSYRSSSSSSSSPPSSPSSSSHRSRPFFLPRVHLTRTSQCSIQETRYAEYLQRRSAMKAIAPHLPYPYSGESLVAVQEEVSGGSRRVQRSLMSEFEGAEETTEEEGDEWRREPK